MHSCDSYHSSVLELSSGAIPCTWRNDGLILAQPEVHCAPDHGGGPEALLQCYSVGKHGGEWFLCKDYDCFNIEFIAAISKHWPAVFDLFKKTWDLARARSQFPPAQWDLYPQSTRAVWLFQIGRHAIAMQQRVHRRIRQCKAEGCFPPLRIFTASDQTPVL